MPSTLTRRRTVAALGAVSTGLLGGCLDSSDSNSDESAPTLHLTLASIGETLREQYVVDLETSRPPWDEDAFRAALNDSSFTTQGYPPFPQSQPGDPAYVQHNGTYYHLDDVVVDQEQATHPVLRLYTVEGQETPDHVAHSDLPRIDQHAVQVAYMAARARGNRGGVPWGLVQRGGYVYRQDEARAASSILDDSGPSHVSYRDTVYRVEVATETFHEAVYRPDVEPVAETDARLERILEAQLVDARLDPNSLSQAERRIVRQARHDGYEASHPFPKELDSLLRKLDERAYIDGNISKDALVDADDRSVLKYGHEYFDYRLRLASGDDAN